MESKLRNLYCISILFILAGTVVSLQAMSGGGKDEKGYENTLAHDADIKTEEEYHYTETDIVQTVYRGNSDDIIKAVPIASLDNYDTSNADSTEALDETLHPIDNENGSDSITDVSSNISPNHQDIISEYGYYTIVKY